MSKYKKLLQNLFPPLAWQLSKNVIRRIGINFNRRLPDGQSLIEEKINSANGIFVHIHKCAGSSMIDAFAHNPNILSCISRPGSFPGRTGRELIPDALYYKCKKFTFVRNPYARVVSAYKMFTSHLTWSNLFPRFDDFVDFIRWTDLEGHQVEEPISIQNFQNTAPDIIHHCSTFHNPKYLLDEMDFIGKLENLDNDLQKVAELLDIQPFEIPHLNKHQKEYDYKKYYTSKSQTIVSALYKKDIEKFGYKF